MILMTILQNNISGLIKSGLKIVFHLNLLPDWFSMSQIFLGLAFNPHGIIPRHELILSQHKNLKIVKQHIASLLVTIRCIQLVFMVPSKT